MRKARIKRLVIDASVARASGTTKHQVSSACRELLELISQKGHLVAFSPDISREWDKHASGFALGWLKLMISRKRREVVSSGSHIAIRVRLDHCQFTPSELAAAIKDFHLIDAALATDRIIFSLDATACALFVQASTKIAELRPIIWTDPSKAPGITQSICAGKSRKEWTLGHK
jgi:hypothetical protein